MFVHSGVEMTLLLLICRMSGVRSVIDLCEWRPALPYAPRFTRFSYESGLIFRLSFGIVAISRTLEERVLKLDPSAPRKLYRRTNLIDPSEFETVRPAPCAGSYLLWAGTLPAYEESVAFIIRAYADVLRRHPEVDLMLCGGASEDCKQRLLSLAATLGIHEGKVRFTGFILRDQLLAYYQNAAVLLIPLEDDERSRARFPFKLGEYLSAARPVVTSAVGDVPLYLTDGQSGMLCPAEDQEAFANAILRLLDDPESAERIGQAGFGVARREFDYRTTGSKFIGYLRSL
jgi:glycosyltransferase involved in cell wall biosynthesis